MTNGISASRVAFNPMSDFDLIVIGSGPGGYVAAIRSAQLGLKTAIVEKSKTLGGVCLNIGCIPSKALLNSSHHYSFARKEAAAHGVVIGDVKLDLPTMLKRKDKTVSQLTGGVAFLMKKNNITRYEGEGRIPAPGQVRVTPVGGGDAQELKAKHIILATGSVPIDLPSMPIDGKTVVTSTEALSFESVPGRLIVIGGGAIGLELGSVWARLGAQVDVVEFLPRIAPGFDLELVQALQKVLAAEGLSFHLETKVNAVETKDGVATVRAVGKDGKELSLEADKVLVSVGRKATLGNAVPDDLGLALDERKRVKVDEHFRTNLPGIYAIGDVIAGPMLAHKAEEEGIACVERIAGKAGHVNYDVIPGVIYTHPELASVGLNEDFAKEKGMAVNVGKFPFRANGRALAGDTAEGFVKLVADAKTDRLLGAHILSPVASELIAEAVSVMEFGGSAEDLARTVHAHPTLSEAVKEAALAVEKRAIHV
jgi:dihydrolipoamide dehydrogenase